MNGNNEKNRGLVGALIAMVFVLLPVVVFAVETDRITVEDPNTSAIKFKVTSDGNVTGASFIGAATDGAAISIQQGPTEASSTVKLAIKDSSGVAKTSLTANGIASTGSAFPVGAFMRTTTAAGGSFDNNAGIASGYSLRTKTSGDMTDGFGGGIIFSIADNGSEPVLNSNMTSLIYSRRDGADNRGMLQFWTTGANASLPTMSLRNSGNVGIGTTAPTQKLEIKEGGIRINTASTTARPTCDTTTRGTFWFTQGTEAPLNDKVEVCAYVDGTLDWKPLW